LKRLKPLNDYIFGKTFGEKGDEEQLLSLLNAILAKSKRPKLTTIEIVEHRTFTAEIIGDKTSILDIRAKTTDGTKINIEVQLRDYKNMDKRSLFYWSREFAKGLNASEKYENLNPVIAINIVNFEVVALPDFHTTFHLREDTHKDYVLTEALEIHFIDIQKFNALTEKNIKNDSLHRWLTFFDQKTPENVLKELMSMDSAIQKANEKMTVLSSDKDVLHEYNLREMALIDYNSGMASAKREREIEIAISMLQDGDIPEKVARCTGLTLEQIQQLQPH
jgi:predicted transposase/invertase (TIGR01784 family)